MTEDGLNGHFDGTIDGEKWEDFLPPFLVCDPGQLQKSPQSTWKV